MRVTNATEAPVFGGVELLNLYGEGGCIAGIWRYEEELKLNF